MKKVRWIIGLILFLLLFTAPAAHAAFFNTDHKDCIWAGIDQEGLCTSTSAILQYNGVFAGLTMDTFGPIKGYHYPNNIDENHPKLVQLRQSSIVNQSGKVIASVYENPPATTYIAVRDFGESYGFLPKRVLAQGPGIGFAGLSPILPIWKVFRNISYFLIAVIMVAVGFMIMFRQKIDPKTVITVQNAIPGIIVTLFIITFSYAIAAIMIDLMYVLLVLIITMLKGSLPGVNLPSTVTDDYLSGNWPNIGWTMFRSGMNSLNDILYYFTGLQRTTGDVVGASIVGMMAGLVSGQPWITGVAAIPLLAILLIAVVLMFAVFRLIFMLLSAYIQIIIAIIVGPIQLLLGAIPGNQAFANWIKNLVANLIVFPLTAALLIIASLLSGYTSTQSEGTPLWSPPIVGVTGYGTTALISLGILLSIPTIVNGLKESFKAKPALPVGGVGQITGFLGTAGQYGMQYYMMKRQESILARQFGGLPRNKDTNLPETAKAGQEGK